MFSAGETENGMWMEGTAGTALLPDRLHGERRGFTWPRQYFPDTRQGRLFPFQDIICNLLA